MRFSSTAGGAVEQGRRRMRAFLLFLGLLCFAVAVVAGFVRIMPAVLAAAAGSLALYARRMSADLDPLWLEIEDGCLKIQMRRQHRLVPLEEVAPRRLQAEEIEHLTRLATSARVTAGTGGFDSHRLGEIDLYASNLANAVLLQMDESATVVTPDEPIAFIEAVSAISRPSAINAYPSDPTA